jgi:hypothetical protein
MRWFGILVGALVLVVGTGLWIRGHLQEARAPVTGFCATLRNGEPWAPAVRRAESRSLHFAKVSPRGAAIEAFRAEREALGQRYGCTVFVEGGRVMSSVGSELPRQ